jgi:hypothetical protein
MSIRASIIDHTLRLKQSHERVVYFFVEHESSESRKAETILRSFIRQLLDPLNVPSSIEAKLRAMRSQEYVRREAWTALLGEVAKTFDSMHLFLDAVDECEAKEQLRILKELSSLASSNSCLRIFLSGREGLSSDVQKIFPNVRHISTTSDLAKSDIGIFVEGALQSRTEDGELIVGDMSILEEVRDRLVQHADGM